MIRSLIAGKFALLGAGTEPPQPKPVTPTTPGFPPGTGPAASASGKRAVLVEFPQDQEQAGCVGQVVQICWALEC